MPSGAVISDLNQRSEAVSGSVVTTKIQQFEGDPCFYVVIDVDNQDYHKSQGFETEAEAIRAAADFEAMMISAGGKPNASTSIN